jgi:5-methylcytosine-specific restriction endonuclease McrA
MRAFSVDHLSHDALTRELDEFLSRERSAGAEALARIAEFDARELYLPAGYPSMCEYCVACLRLTRQAALKRIRAGRTARRYPAIFPALAEGRLSLSAVILLTPHLTEENVDELLAAAADRSKSEIEQLLARRLSEPELPGLGSSTSNPSAEPEVSPGTLGRAPGGESGVSDALVASDAGITPALERFPLPRISKPTHDKLQYARELLSHAVPSGDFEQVLDRALDALIRQLEKRKFGSGTKSRPRAPRASNNPRHIPAEVREAVWKRDQGRCTFVGENGHRCGSRRLLQFDHAVPVARGGAATVENLRLRCAGHNALEANRSFGAKFMKEKRDAKKRAKEEQEATAEARANSSAHQQAEDVLAGLRQLGCRADLARRAVEHCMTLPACSLEERMRAALTMVGPKGRVQRIAAAPA